MATPGVGQDIEDICTRCGDTWHVVMAKVGERVVKVVCKLCGSQHNYRGENNPAAGSTSSAWSARRRRTVKRAAPSVPVAPEFDPSKPPRAYSVQASYLAGERIVHPSFGIGVVAGSPGPGKVDVVFPNGLRTLATSKAASTLERPVAAANVPIADRPPDRVADDPQSASQGADKVRQHN